MYNTALLTLAYKPLMALKFIPKIDIISSCLGAQLIQEESMAEIKNA